MKSAASNWLASLTSFQHSALASYNLTSVHPVGFRLVANLIVEIYALIPNHVKRESRNISVRILSFLTSTMSHKMPTTSETELIKVMHHHQHHPHSEIPVIFLTSQPELRFIHLQLLWDFRTLFVFSCWPRHELADEFTSKTVSGFPWERKSLMTSSPVVSSRWTHGRNGRYVLMELGKIVNEILNTLH